MKQEHALLSESDAAEPALLYRQALLLLKQLISIPSFSKEEQGTAELIRDFFLQQKIPVTVSGNNVWLRNNYFHPSKPTILLNSHHDTVKPAKTYTRNPFAPDVEEDRLYGLGSNDAGVSLVSLIAAFLYFNNASALPFNLVLAATAEEEISGKNGIESILPQLGEIHLAIVGEPTHMNLAIAERGLLVLDCIARGQSGHAAREEGVNALYMAMQDIQWFKNFVFPKKSALLGEVKMSVTMIQCGTQHNLVPDVCSFTADVRVNECYTNEEVLEIVRQHVHADVEARSLRLGSSSISMDHAIVKCGLAMGMQCYGSPTSSDQAVIPWPSVKIGPGDSARSHTADEFIYLHELKDGIEKYIQLLKLYAAALKQSQ